LPSSRIGLELHEHIAPGDGLGVLALRGALGLGQGALERLQVGEQQLARDRVDVAQGVDRAVDMGDLFAARRLLEAADHLHDRVDLADVAQERVAHALALARPADDARDVDEPQRRGDELLALDQAADGLEARVGDGDDADIGLDGGERIVRRQRPGRGQCVEQRALAHIGQPDDPCFHGVPARVSRLVRIPPATAGQRTGPASARRARRC
jgi:hypothetical protein